VLLGEKVFLERQYPVKNRYFMAINSSSARTVADRHRHAA